MIDDYDDDGFVSDFDATNSPRIAPGQIAARESANMNAGMMNSDVRASGNDPLFQDN